MRPLQVENLSPETQVLLKKQPRLAKWVALSDAVTRAEKVSSWRDWTAEQTAAYGKDDFRLFSRLRGYSDAECAEFGQYHVLTEELMLTMDELDLWDLHSELHLATRTPELEQITKELFQYSNATPAECLKAV